MRIYSILIHTDTIWIDTTDIRFYLNLAQGLHDHLQGPGPAHAAELQTTSESFATEVKGQQPVGGPQLGRCCWKFAAKTVAAIFDVRCLLYLMLRTYF